MKTTLILFFLMSSFITATSVSDYNSNSADAILGKWMVKEGNLKVNVYRENNVFKANVLWFDDTDDKTKPLERRLDEKNHNKQLRNRKILGLDVLRNLQYDPIHNEWTGGKIYDSSSGREWDASLSLTKEGLLKVRGFWHFEIFGKTIYFKRI